MEGKKLKYMYTCNVNTTSNKGGNLMQTGAKIGVNLAGFRGGPIEVEEFSLLQGQFIGPKLL